MLRGSCWWTIGALAFATPGVLACRSDARGTGSPAPPPPPIDVAFTTAFDPVDLPDPKVPGFRFPEPAETVLGWATTRDEASLATHAWGLWTALTLDSGQRFEGLPLRVFETWYSLDDLLAARPVGTRARRAPRPLGELEKLARGREKRTGGGPVAAMGLPSNATPGPDPRQAAGEHELFGFVKFNRPAGEHIARNRLLSIERLTGLLTDAGETTIEPFPGTTIALKAIYETYATTPGGPVGADGGNPAAPFALFPVWSGPPSPPAPSPSSSWRSCVWIDLRDPTDGPATGDVDTTCDPTGASRTPATTYGLGRFVYFTLTAPEAAAQHPPSSRAVGTQAHVGDVVILAGMHVTTRETDAWTWATFFWTPRPDDPPVPSTAAFASRRPAILAGAARGYAGCSILSMQNPVQPLTGGRADGESVYCYNPYLEGQFTSKDMPDSRPGRYRGQPVRNDVGSETNCMACHAHASYALLGQPRPQYTGDRYVDLKDPEFRGVLQTDFLWSVPENATNP